MKDNKINKNLAEEIESKIHRLNIVDETELNFRCKRLTQKDIERNSRVHSYRIENPKLEVPFSVTRNKHKREIKEGIRNLTRAFEWGCFNFNPDNFDEFFIRGIAGKITPELYSSSIAKYREVSARISGSSVMPPYPFKVVNYEIPAFVQSLKEQLKCPKVVNKIETAVYSHLHLARIHPFYDGNGRTARILQDVILCSYNIPVPVIETGERMTYYDLLDKAVVDMRDRDAVQKNGKLTDGERVFYNYIGGKINLSLDKIIKTCSL
jgi:Fic family protein